MRYSDLTLRALEPEDADFLYEAESDEEAWRWSDYTAPLSREMLRNYALTYDADPFRAGQLRLILEFDGEQAGIVDLFDISPLHLRASTGIYLLPSFRGQGLSTRALELLKDFAKMRLRLHQLTAIVSEANAPALRTYKSAGFNIAGHLHDWLKNYGGMDSTYSPALLLSLIL